LNPAYCENRGEIPSMRLPCVAPPGTLTFRFSGNRRFNGVRITLNARDLYDVAFLKLPGRKAQMRGDDEPKVLTEVNHLYHDMLVPSFERSTALALSA